MIKYIWAALAGSLFVTVAACSISVGPVNPKPTVSELEGNVNRPLKVYLSSRIQDKVVIKSAGLKDVNVSGFRASLERGIRNTISPKFKDLQFVPTVDRSDLLLAVDYVTPGLERLTSGDMPLVTFTMDYSVLLLDKDFQVGSDKAKIHANQSLTTIFSAEEVFEDALAVLLKRINDRLFDERAVRMIQPK